MKFAFPMMMFALLALPASAQELFEKDIFKSTAGDIEITFVGHGSLIIKAAGQIIYIDPFGTLTEYSKLPKADLILVTHDHFDHLDIAAIDKIRTKNTKVVLTEIGAGKLSGGIVMKNGDTQTVTGVKIEAVPAYNLIHKRDTGQPFHPKGQGNGYVLTFGDKRIYVAGDTENTPEMKALKNIDIAFLPMNLPYTMAPEMVADAALAFKPRVLYPYHYGETDTSRITALLGNNKDIEVRIRKMK
jgi:L-ascorbate metabolism protein UlaG (beta-lactamase superfamily)